MQLPQDIEQALRDIVLAREQGHPLILKPTSTSFGAGLADLEADTVSLTPTFAAREAAFPRDRHDLALVIDAPDTLGRQQTHELLARLRNTQAAAVVAAFARPETDNPSWGRGDFLALGFRQAAAARALASPYWLYRYDIQDYKLTPDWLSSRHWANPERWGKERW
ncbi:DUF6231 family protein [Salinisphaera sp. Q1T1-3]|uniref:DUF6231 family protein n=1 Tax=Salinisphaera sp. Q1T1-3 TaxID=2321229 RepID=UPI000E711C34|nr:DUF6231 family protein [Salinisphaera sp. Q1T1-3]RJS92067.1 hypothetical protein D3260_13065 [Salinisphaera sp. Q1T1-3]